MRNMDELKIDDVAKQSGLTKRTIRYYEQIGLLPSPPRSKGGIRLYSQQHVEFLKKITNAKEVLGFTLQELQHFISLSNTLEQQRVKYRQVKGTSEQKDKAEDLIQALTDLLNTVDAQLLLIEQKKEKILKVESELMDLKSRAEKAIERLEKEK